jgi:hypothetical protein
MNSIHPNKVYTSPVRKLVRFFEQSRDQWKKKCRAAKAEIKRLAQQVKRLKQSRAHWKSRAKTLEQELARSQAQAQAFAREVERLQAESLESREFPSRPAAMAVRLSHQHYSVGHWELFLALVLSAGVSLRGASQTLSVVFAFFQLEVPVPTWQTGRLWLLRVGYYKLTRPKEGAGDWVWILDHTVQVGNDKGLLILGVRLSVWQARRGRLTHEDMEPLALYPVRHSDGTVVYQQLEETTAQTGLPRAIVSDHGSDLKAGVERFGAAHPETRLLYDIKHKTAAVLKRELEQDARWSQFTQLAAQTKRQVQQTALAAFAPPNQRSKARYLNLEELVEWGQGLLTWLDAHPATLPMAGSEKLTWVQDFRTALHEWQECLHVVDITESLVRQEGFYQGLHGQLKKQLVGIAQTPPAQRVRAELLRFVAEEESQARPHEHLPGSSEVIESVFGKFKHLERDQARSGLTGFLLSVCALVATTTQDVIRQALETVSTQEVLKWCKDNLGLSVQALRREIFNAPDGAEQKWEQLFGSA